MVAAFSYLKSIQKHSLPSFLAYHGDWWSPKTIGGVNNITLQHLMDLFGLLLPHSRILPMIIEPHMGPLCLNSVIEHRGRTNVIFISAEDVTIRLQQLRQLMLLHWRQVTRNQFAQIRVTSTSCIFLRFCHLSSFQGAYFMSCVKWSCLCPQTVWSDPYRGPTEHNRGEGHTQGQLEAGLEADSAVGPRVCYLDEANRFSQNLHPLHQHSQLWPSGIRGGRSSVVGSGLHSRFEGDSGGVGGGGGIILFMECMFWLGCGCTTCGINLYMQGDYQVLPDEKGGDRQPHDDLKGHMACGWTPLQ